ncbi:VOC family protein [Halorussus halophilus]|uniref:VOC family protein n=1 Tax=Halorussus halophilus TaxID=2650975 RepID=UPI001301233C|nr:VOC family protein [Halorussus halophilus]
MDRDAQPRIGHVHLHVADADEAIEFYAGILGLEVRERYDGYAALTWGENGHDIALHGGEAARGCRVAIEVPSADSLVTVYRACDDHGVSIEPIDHGVTKSLYFEDPDGNEWEVYLDTRGEEGDLETYFEALETAEKPPSEARETQFDPESLVT